MNLIVQPRFSYPPKLMQRAPPCFTLDYLTFFPTITIHRTLVSNTTGETPSSRVCTVSWEETKQIPIFVRGLARCRHFRSNSTQSDAQTIEQRVGSTFRRRRNFEPNRGVILWKLANSSSSCRSDWTLGLGWNLLTK